MVTIASFNVNGIRSVNTKAKDGTKGCCPAENVIQRLAHEQSVDILCLQETKTNSITDLETYRSVYPWIYARFSTTKKGYSGVAILSRHEPIEVTEPCIGCSPADDEGRLVCAEFADFILISCYTPNTKNDLARLEERLEWDAAFSIYVNALAAAKNKPLVIAGDLNCAHLDIDVHNPSRQRKARAAGFTDEERSSFTCLLAEVDATDTFRLLHPDDVKYSWWSAITRGRERNVGWRIDYILVTGALKARVESADILNEYYGSDHCPVIVTLRPSS
jgi:exodeoxyribonuclease-3